MAEKRKLGIVGLGMVGGALQRYFKKNNVKPLEYDTGKKIGSMDDINKADLVFICVPTPYDEKKGYDLTYVLETMNKLTGEKSVVIKSTLLPGTTEKLQIQYPQHKMLFNPEFLVESRADETMVKPDRQLVGYTEKSKDVAEHVMSILPRAPYEKIMPATEAEMVKYFGNTFLAHKVIFANHMYDLCEKMGIDYTAVADASAADPRIHPSHLDVFHAGYRGYGGKCLPKDMRGLIQLANEIGVKLPLHEKAEEINNKLIKEQGIDDHEKYSELNPHKK